MEGFLSERDLQQIEKAHPEGLTSAQILYIFQNRGAKFSEATFRKYVQLGLLPRCKRVGTKGKHRGSHGLYPSPVVRRINTIKHMMGQNYTIEEIQRLFGNFKQQIDHIEGALDELLGSFTREIAEPRFDSSRRRIITREIDQAKKSAADLVRQIIQIETSRDLWN